MLDKRLKICADMVSGRGAVCDVGTDHAYLAAELVKSGKCKRAIASDINEGPLEAAAKTVEKYAVADKVELVLSDGLERVCLDDVTDVVIAGMGGETIAGILEGCPEVCDGDISLILQPMTKAELLREWLGENGFSVLEETAVQDGERLYTVIRAVYDGAGFAVSEARCMRGFADVNSSEGERYLCERYGALMKKADALEKAGRTQSALHARSTAEIVRYGHETYGAMEIYDFLDSIYPFSMQEKWDNSGFLVEKYGGVDTVLLTLDIDMRAIEEARRTGAQLIISHHPVIFEPLKKIEVFSPVMELIRSDIGAVCMHTNLDKAEGGTNGAILRRLSQRLRIDGDPEPLEMCGDGNGLGFIVNLKYGIAVQELAGILKEIFGCETIRMNARSIDYVSRIAVCSGSGGSMLGEALEKGCDAYITGDVKHDVWVEANNRAITLFDCGHFHTENIVLDDLRSVLEKQFPRVEFVIAKGNADPCVYF